jgi:hypothetical protein
MTLDEMRALDALKTWKELEEARGEIVRLTKEKEEAQTALLIVDDKLGFERKFVGQLLERIKRMETAGNAMAAYDFIPDNLAERWAAAKETER